MGIDMESHQTSENESRTTRNDKPRISNSVNEVIHLNKELSSSLWAFRWIFSLLVIKKQWVSLVVILVQQRQLGCNQGTKSIDLAWPQSCLNHILCGAYGCCRGLRKVDFKALSFRRWVSILAGVYLSLCKHPLSYVNMDCCWGMSQWTPKVNGDHWRKMWASSMLRRNVVASLQLDLDSPNDHWGKQCARTIL